MGRAGEMGRSKVNEPTYSAKLTYTTISGAYKEKRRHVEVIRFKTTRDPKAYLTEHYIPTYCTGVEDVRFSEIKRRTRGSWRKEGRFSSDPSPLGDNLPYPSARSKKKCTVSDSVHPAEKRLRELQRRVPEGIIITPKKSCTLMRSDFEIMMSLTREQQAEMILAAMEYGFNRITPTFEGRMKIVWDFIFPNLEIGWIQFINHISKAENKQAMSEILALKEQLAMA